MPQYLGVIDGWMVELHASISDFKRANCRKYVNPESSERYRILEKEVDLPVPPSKYLGKTDAQILAYVGRSIKVYEEQESLRKAAKREAKQRDKDELKHPPLFGGK